MATVTTLHRVCICLGVLALILQIIGFSTAGWLIVGIHLDALPTNPSPGLDKMITHAGVWYVRLCFQGSLFESCSTTSQHDQSSLGISLSSGLSDLSNINWTELAVETTLALVACILGVGFTCVVMCKKAPHKVFYAIAAGAMAFSGVVLMPAVIKVGSNTQSTQNTLDLLTAILGTEFITLGVPWSLIIDCFAVVVVFITAIILIVAACKKTESTGATVAPVQAGGVPVQFIPLTGTSPGTGVQGHPAYGYMYPTGTAQPQGTNLRPNGLYNNQQGDMQPPPYTEPYPTKT